MASSRARRTRCRARCSSGVLWPRRKSRTSASPARRRAAGWIVRLRRDVRHHKQAPLLLDDRADVELCAPLPCPPRLRVVLLTGIDQQLRQRATGGFHLVLIEAARFDEASRRGIRHEDLPGLSERGTRILCHGSHPTCPPRQCAVGRGTPDHRTPLRARRARSQRPSGASPRSRNQLETVVPVPCLRTAARTAASSVLLSFSVTICVRAAAPSDGRPILRLRFPSFVRGTVMVLVAWWSSTYGIPKVDRAGSR